MPLIKLRDTKDTTTKTLTGITLTERQSETLDAYVQFVIGESKETRSFVVWQMLAHVIGKDADFQATLRAAKPARPAKPRAVQGLKTGT